MSIEFVLAAIGQGLLYGEKWHSQNEYVCVFSGTEQSVPDRMCSANAMNVTSFLCFSVVVRMFFRWTVPCCDEWFLHRRERRYNSSPMHYKAYECADLCCVLCACEICGMHLHVIRSNKRKPMFWREKKQKQNKIEEWKSLKAEKTQKYFVRIAQLKIKHSICVIKRVIGLTECQQ